MMHHRQLLACVLPALVAGCTRYNFDPGIARVTRLDPVERYGEPRVAKIELGGALRLLGDGTVELALDVTSRCERTVDKLNRVRLRAEREYSAQVLSAVSGFLSGAGVIIGAPIWAAGLDEAKYAVFVGAGFLVAAVTPLIVHAARPRTKTRIQTATEPSSSEVEAVACGARQLDAERYRVATATLTLRTPWGATVSNKPVGGRVAFAVDWRASGIDPLAGDAAQRIRRPWIVDATTEPPMPGEHVPPELPTLRWTPDAATAERALVVIGKATGISTEVVDGEVPPLLEILGPLADDPVVAGARTRFTVRLANRGQGTAYRVVATTKSSVQALHGLRFPFGKIAPTATVERSVEAIVPDGTTSAVIVVDVTEAHANTPNPQAFNFTVRQVPRPRLTVACTVRQDTLDVTAKRLVDAAHQLVMRCVVANRGNAPAIGGHVEVAFDQRPPRTSPTRDIAAGASQSFDLIVQVPPEARTDDAFAIRATAIENGFRERSVPWVLPVAVRIGGEICGDRRPMPRAEFDRKIAELKKNARELGFDDDYVKAMEVALTGCL